MSTRVYFVRVDNNSDDHVISITHPSLETENEIKEGSYVHISNVEDREEKLVVNVISVTGRGTKYEVTVSKMIAESLKINSLSSKVCVHLVEEKDVELDFAMLAFKRQFVQRGDMMRFKKAVIGRITYSGQTVNVENVTSQVQEIDIARCQVRSGIITPRTNIVFRSRSARIYWLVQICTEMWEFDKSGRTYFEVFLDQFVSPILDQWRAKDVSHSLSVVFFARTFFVNGTATPNGPRSHADSTATVSGGSGSYTFAQDIPLRTGSCLSSGGGGGGLGGSTPSVKPPEDGSSSPGLSYQDFFKVVIDNSTVYDKTIVLSTLRGEFLRFPRTVGWRLDQCLQEEVAVPSGAAEGNFLEAINTTLNVLDKHYMDRDLVRTGNSIVMISPGCGFFKVEPRLAQITKQRMMDNGIGMDLISLSQP